MNRLVELKLRVAPAVSGTTFMCGVVQSKSCVVAIIIHLLWFYRRSKKRMAKQVKVRAWQPQLLQPRPTDCSGAGARTNRHAVDK